MVFGILQRFSIPNFYGPDPAHQGFFIREGGGGGGKTLGAHRFLREGQMPLPTLSRKNYVYRRLICGRKRTLVL